MRHFKNPPKEYRPAPFWAWNDKLDPVELARQVAGMAKAGYGGYFMHSRIGLATRYLGVDWMKAIGACIEAGKKHDMQSWLYDEDKWPSGSAGGMVTRDHPERAAKFLVEDKSLTRGVTRMACFDYDANRRRYRRLSPGENARSEILAYRMARSTGLGGVNPEQGANNRQPYGDLLDPDVVEAFLRISYDPYATRFKRHFGAAVPGIFTDEPHVCRHGHVPWTEKLPDTFTQLHGYDLLDRLPDLHHDTPTAKKTRHDFWHTVGHLFRESFARKLYERCERLGLALTGHYLLELPLANQARCSGALMPLYTFEHMPGIDHLCRRNSDTVHMTQVASVAAQTGRRRVMSEMFGCSGHSMSFEDQKWLLNLHFANGVNFVNPHLTLYSMRGDNKRDYPPTFSEHQPYWKDMRAINDTIARCAVALSTGRPAADILVLHPVASVWCHLHARGHDAGADKIDRELTALTTHLSAIQRDYHFGDETIIEEIGRVSGKTFSVGEMNYRAVIVPPSLTWRTETVDMLRRFRGPILFVGELPTLVDATKSDAWKALLARKNVKHIPLRRDDIERALSASVPADIAIDAKDGPRASVRIHQRRSGKTRIAFLANTDRRRTVRVRVAFNGAGCVKRLDPRTGQSGALDARGGSGKTAVDVELPPVGSAILEMRPGARRKVVPCRLREVSRRRLAAPFVIERSHPNVATLDYARVKIGEGRCSARLPLHRLRERILDHFDVPPNGEVQPWVLAEEGFRLKRRERVSLRFDVHVTDIPSQIAFAMEWAERWRISVNGHRVRPKQGDWFIDRQFGRVDITRHVKRGNNVIEISTRYNWDLPIEDAYLAGDFAVAMSAGGKRYTITKEGAALRIGDWVGQGLPFYSGSVSYRKEIDLDVASGTRQFLKVRFAGTLARVRVNGVECDSVLWAPWETEITKALRDGTNVIEIDVVSSLRNTMGPLHNALNRDLEWTGPNEFSDKETWTDVYQFEPYGLMGRVDLVSRRAAPA